jgi:hypothetical protein
MKRIVIALITAIALTIAAGYALNQSVINLHQLG